MASEQSLTGLLAKLKSSVDASTHALPPEDSALPPENGISLLDTKSDLFLSYLQNLVFLILVKLRKNKHKIASQDADTHEDTIESLESADAAAVQRLVELRVYLEKGVRTLEGRLKYQIDKVLRAVDTASQAPKSKQQKSHNKKLKTSKDKQTSGVTIGSASASDGESLSNIEDDDTSDSASAASEIDELSYRPNPAALARATAPRNPPSRGEKNNTPTDGIYRPPKITPTTQPVSDPDARSNARRPAKPLRSAAVDDYIAAELETGPAAEASVGSTIAAGGRATTSARERAREAERREFEEANFTRLPRESKKARAAERARAGGAAAAGTMGEFELGALGALGDRVARATAKRGSGKRGRETADGPRGEGTGGAMFLDSGGKGKKKRRMM